MDAVLVIGIGNAMRGDDAAGLVVADLIADSGSGIASIRHEGDGAALLDAWAGYDAVILVDAMVSGLPPGSVRVFRNPKSLPRVWSAGGTHSVNVVEALELASVLGRLPASIRVVGIEGQSFGLGEPVSAEVEDATKRVAREIIERYGA